MIMNPKGYQKSFWKFTHEFDFTRLTNHSKLILVVEINANTPEILLHRLI